MGALSRPNVSGTDLAALFDALHNLHHRAGWPSLRDMAKELGCSRTTVLAAFSEPRLPKWGLLELIVETLGGDVERFHELWLAAGTPDRSGTSSTTPPLTAQPTTVGPRELPGDVRGFVGRAAELATLDHLTEQARTGQAMVAALISGTAGVGKTALAVHWARRAACQFPDGQLYLNLRGYDPDEPMSTAVALERLLRTLGLSGADIPSDVAERAARFRTLTDRKRILVVLDNAHRPDQVHDLLPGSEGCVVLVTSRDTLPALVARYGAVRISLGRLPPAEAFSLLRGLIGPRAAAEPASAAVLARRCARLPLALRLVAELAVSRPALPLAELVAEMEDESRRLDLLSAGDDEHTAARAVFAHSLRHLTGDAANAFALLGLHRGADIDLAAATALFGVDPAAARTIQSRLARAHLIEEVGADRVAMHDLLRAFAAERAEGLAEPVRAGALTRLLDHYLDSATDARDRGFPSPGGEAITSRFADAPAAVRWFDAERANLLTAARLAATTSPGHTVGLSRALAAYLDAHSHYHDAHSLHDLARSVARASGDRAGEATTTGLFATACGRLGDNREALRHHQMALEMHRETGDRRGEGAALHGLALACWRLGRYREAFRHVGAALEVYRETGDRAGEGRALYALGLAHLQLGRYPDALRTHEQALAVHCEIGDRRGEGRTRNNLGMVYERLARDDDARTQFAAALAIAAEVGNRVGEAVALGNLADLKRKHGHHADAERDYRHVLVLFQELDYRVGQAETMRGLGVVAHRTGRLDEAVHLLDEAVSLAHDLGDATAETYALLDLGLALHDLGRSADAVQRHVAALALTEDTADPYARAEVLTGSALVLRDIGDTAAARRALEQAYTAYSRLGLTKCGEVRSLLAELDDAMA
ncbi:Flp pilus assembly protein TadD, contains TPR repeats [Actinokineospora alba]|uniref:Flp pilus assembly protein TadD, contains TPR repeats n=1 Tax=Actinokineospora alba TaxID=504798 RepID=A0A1H0QP03_9PSEU|nr:tetratricopeptide repeat protein [Actinokineospora alba]TDP70459.1 Flp pilus assembly protein TadD [Actinokineospora alba]SDI31147.1 Flp pilus assembly protein TadD, contains TPR repeats [Actinokineospora alba]SDP19113.1 Flp pilus assembly protein TadD, contains TPR repeats [Actinokineospora alba]